MGKVDKKTWWLRGAKWAYKYAVQVEMTQADRSMAAKAFEDCGLLGEAEEQQIPTPEQVKQIEINAKTIEQLRIVIEELLTSYTEVLRKLSYVFNEDKENQ